MANPCECGCGTETKNRFVHGHNGKLQQKMHTTAQKSQRWRDSHPEYKERQRILANAYYHKNREAIREKRKLWWHSKDPNWHTHRMRNGQYKRSYGITVKQYEEMLKEQDGKCALCGSEHADIRFGRLCIDHNHKTNKVRGLLCRKCNAALERVDSIPNWLSNASNYIERSEHEEVRTLAVTA